MHVSQDLEATWFNDINTDDEENVSRDEMSLFPKFIFYLFI